MESKYYKSFILEHVLNARSLFKVEFYRNLQPGEYIGLTFIRLGKERKEINGFYQHGLLLYSKTENMFFNLLPCRYTKEKFQDINSFLLNENNVIVLTKKENNPIWREDDLSNYFNLLTQIYVHDDAGKIIGRRTRSFKEYLKFVKKYEKAPMMKSFLFYYYN